MVFRQPSKVSIAKENDLHLELCCSIAANKEMIMLAMQNAFDPELNKPYLFIQSYLD